MDPDEIARRRTQYETDGFDVVDAHPDPLVQFRSWFDAVVDSLDEPGAMVLATASPSGRPSARTVLLRGIDDRGIVFHTNYTSAKAQDLEANEQAELVFLWMPAHRQVRVHGRVERLPADESDAYFASRPRGSQIGAWSSPQSEVVADRSALEQRIAETEGRFDGADIPRPGFWGGYLVRPATWEFWQGRRDRLHDRVRYRLEGATWVEERLAP